MIVKIQKLKADPFAVLEYDKLDEGRRGTLSQARKIASDPLAALDTLELPEE